MTAAELAKAMLDYLTETGWQREERGSAWFIHPEFGEESFGDAVTTTFREMDNIDVRMPL